MLNGARPACHCRDATRAIILLRKPALGGIMKKLAVLLGMMGLMTAAAQAGPTSPPSGVLGVLNSDGSFRPVLRGAGHDGVAPPPPKYFVGTLKLTLNIAVDSTLPSGTGILCGLNATVSGVSSIGNLDAIEDVGQKLASGSGGTATCTVEVPYSWRLTAYESAEVSDSAMLSFTVTAVGTGQQGRTTVESFDTIAIPKNGKTTAYTLNARI
jgi:hypothetical protein